MDLNDQFIDELASEYSNCFKLDTSPQVCLKSLMNHKNFSKFCSNANFKFHYQVKQIEESIEENLTHLEEFCTMIDLIRNENNSNLSNLVPDFNAKKRQLRLVYAKIDKLLELVDSVKSTVDLMDEQLSQAELKFNQNSKSSKFTKFISNLITGNGVGSAGNHSASINTGNASSLDHQLPANQFQSPFIFSAEDFFLSDS